MSRMIAVVGNHSTGKTSSLMKLDPKETFIISCLSSKSELPFPKAKEYSVENKNLLATEDWSEIIKYLVGIDEKMPHIKTVVIDDFTYLLTGENIKRAKEAGFTKFTDIGQHGYFVTNTAVNLKREDLTVIFIFHEELTVEGTLGIKERKIKTAGKMLEAYFKPEGLFNIILYTHVDFNEDGKAVYQLVTNKTVEYPAKSPMGMFEDIFIPNDIASVLDRITAYYTT